MPPRPVRQFTLIDAMILVAAAALGMAGIRAERTPHFHHAASCYVVPMQPLPVPEDLSVVINTNFKRWGGDFDPCWPVPEAGPRFTRLAARGLAALSLAMLLIRLRHPRPPRLRLIRQPGLVASLGVTVALGIPLLLTLLQLLLEQFRGTGQAAATMPAGLIPSHLSEIACRTIRPDLAGIVVLAGWLVLALGGRCRRERQWIDRGGIIVGLGWVGLLLIDEFSNLIVQA